MSTLYGCNTSASCVLHELVTQIRHAHSLLLHHASLSVASRHVQHIPPRLTHPTVFDISHCIRHIPILSFPIHHPSTPCLPCLARSLHHLLTHTHVCASTHGASMGSSPADLLEVSWGGGVPEGSRGSGHCGGHAHKPSHRVLHECKRRGAHTRMQMMRGSCACTHPAAYLDESSASCACMHARTHARPCPHHRPPGQASPH